MLTEMTQNPFRSCNSTDPFHTANHAPSHGLNGGDDAYSQFAPQNEFDDAGRSYGDGAAHHFDVQQPQQSVVTTSPQHPFLPPKSLTPEGRHDDPYDDEIMPEHNEASEQTEGARRGSSDEAMTQDKRKAQNRAA